jgi:hypothetical protein
MSAPRRMRQSVEQDRMQNEPEGACDASRDRWGAETIVAKWRKPISASHLPTGPTDSMPTLLTPGVAAIIVAFQWHRVMLWTDAFLGLSRPCGIRCDYTCTAVCSGTTSADCPRSYATRLRRRRTAPTRSAPFTLILLRFTRRIASGNSSLPSTAAHRWLS